MVREHQKSNHQRYLNNFRQESTNFAFKWTWTVDRLKVTDSSDQIVNHFDNFDEIGSKTGLLKNLRKLQGTNCFPIPI